MRVFSYAVAATSLFLAVGCGDATDTGNGTDNNGDVPAGQTVEITDNITADTTWEAGTYILNGDFAVEAQLTIEPCTTIQADHRIFVRRGGAIVAIGTEDCPITFTSKKSTPAAGDWTFLQVSDDADNGNEFEHVIFEYGGNEHGIVFLYGGASFRNTTVRHTAELGMKLSSGKVLEFSNMTFEEIPGHPFQIAPNDVDMIDGVTTTNVQDDMISVTNDVMTEDGTWTPQSIPYQLYGDTRIEARLELAPGTTVKMTPGDRGFVRNGGSIHALGTESEPIVIESANSTPVAGDWKQFTFEEDGEASVFRHTTIRHGGSEGHGVLVVRGNMTLENVTFEENQECDIRDATNVTATETTFIECN